eukprot:1160541-Pelagomonas_calceolata.AAC.3
MGRMGPRCMPKAFKNVKDIFRANRRKQLVGLPAHIYSAVLWTTPIAIQLYIAQQDWLIFYTKRHILETSCTIVLLQILAANAMAKAIIRIGFLYELEGEPFQFQAAGNKA